MKKIHQLFVSENIPVQLSKLVNKIKNLNPKYKYILWTDITMEKFIVRNYPHYYKIYKSYTTMIQRVDFFSLFNYISLRWLLFRLRCLFNQPTFSYESE